MKIVKEKIKLNIYKVFKLISAQFKPLRSCVSETEIIMIVEVTLCGDQPLAQSSSPLTLSAQNNRGLPIIHNHPVIFNSVKFCR